MFDFANRSRVELLELTGRIGQIAGVRRFTYNDGNAKGLDACRVKTGSGLEFTVLEGRSMELYDLSFKGINLAFMYKNGLTNPMRVPQTPNEFLNYGVGGMMYTSGLMNSGQENTVDGLFQPLHGRISEQGAEQVQTYADFDPDSVFRIRLSGKTQESRLFEHQLNLHRSYSTELNADYFDLKDTIENPTCRPIDFSLMYHINFGYPFIDEGTELILPEGSECTARDDWSQENIDDRFKVTKPSCSYVEHLYYYSFPNLADDDVTAIIRNQKLGLEVHLSYSNTKMPWLMEWKSMGSGDYCFAVMPSTSSVKGREEELKENGLTTIAPYQTYETGFRFKVVEI
ncbi:MAG: DUF4432 family protein [Clostridiaceae bacterium]|nr:DUF4432 family protein [Clostridiaceae bacterium]